MKFSSSILTLLFSSLVASRGLSLFGSDSQHILDDSTKVPGDNPLEYCTAERAGEILELEYADLSPNPPKPYVSLFSLLFSLLWFGYDMDANGLAADKHSPSPPRANSPPQSRTAHT